MFKFSFYERVVVIDYLYEQRSCVIIIGIIDLFCIFKFPSE